MADALKFAMDAAPRTKPSTRKGRHSHKPIESRGPPINEMFLSLQSVPACQGSSTPISSSSQRSEHDDPLSTRRRSSVRASANNRTPSPAMNQPAAGEDLFLHENTSIARQQLTSSASRVRPSKQQQDVASRRSGADRQQGVSHSNNSNNNEDEDEPIVEEESARYNTRAHVLATRDAMHWSNSDRAHRYLDASPTEQSDTEPFPHSHRPPSRQCHAFPTDLLVPREFFSPAKHADASVNITPWHNDEEDDAHASSARPEDDSSEPQAKAANHHRTRPPSRYMTKPSRGGASSASSTSSSTSASPGEDSATKRLPSRRGVAAGSFNQATAQHHHDPKTDGFADVDESVPPPFRIEISTDSSQSQYIPSQHRRVDEDRRHSLKSRRSSSFGTRAQLKQQEERAQRQKSYAVVDDDEPHATKRPSKSRHSKKSQQQQPQWLGGDQEQGETVPVKQSTRPTAASRKGGASDNNNSSNNSKTNARSIAAVAAPQWFRATNNPFFEAESTAAYEDMDPETAIANTPLFAGEDDLMAITQLSDLCLDDFMGDPSAAAAPSYSTTATQSVNNSTSAPPPSASLNTSLGKDFLSLFAQH